MKFSTERAALVPRETFGIGFAPQVRAHGARMHLAVHVDFVRACQDYRARRSEGADAPALAAAHRAAVKLVESSDHLLCANPREKHRMLQLLEAVRTDKSPTGESVGRRLTELAKDSERVVVDTILPSFRKGPGYRAYLDELFPPIKPDGDGDLAAIS